MAERALYIRERWLGNHGVRVPQIFVERIGAIQTTDGSLVLDGASYAAAVFDDLPPVPVLRQLFEEGVAIVVRACSKLEVVAALRRPEVSAVAVPESAGELVLTDFVSPGPSTPACGACSR